MKQRKIIEWERLENSKKLSIKGTFHAKMGTIKDRNSMDLQKQKVLRGDGKNTQKNYAKKILKTQ